MVQKLKGKVALVTGGSRGIGAAIAKALADEGAIVAISYVSSPEKAEAVVREIVNQGGQAKAYRADQGDLKQVNALVEAVAKEFGRLDILVNNAAILKFGPVDEMESLNKYDRLYAVNLHGVIATIRAALKIMKDGGRIITIGSAIATRVGFLGFADYAATKAALVGFTKGASRDLAKRNITINVLQPGVIETDMSATAGNVDKEDFLSTIAQGRYGTSQEIAAGVVFLASPEASYVTGSVLNIDGGYSA